MSEPHYTGVQKGVVWRAPKLPSKQGKR
jgi:hypothetical protein